VSERELREQWTLYDLLRAHEALDLEAAQDVIAANAQTRRR
jgi:hypothetical protein